MHGCIGRQHLSVLPKDNADKEIHRNNTYMSTTYKNIVHACIKFKNKVSNSPVLESKMVIRECGSNVGAKARLGRTPQRGSSFMY